MVSEEILVQASEAPSVKKFAEENGLNYGSLRVQLHRWRGRGGVAKKRTGVKKPRRGEVLTPGADEIVNIPAVGSAELPIMKIDPTLADELIGNKTPYVNVERVNTLPRPKMRGTHSKDSDRKPDYTVDASPWQTRFRRLVDRVEKLEAENARLKNQVGEHQFLWDEDRMLEERIGDLQERLELAERPHHCGIWMRKAGPAHGGWRCRVCGKYA